MSYSLNLSERNAWREYCLVLLDGCEEEMCPGIECCLAAEERFRLAVQALENCGVERKTLPHQKLFHYDHLDRYLEKKK